MSLVKSLASAGLLLMMATAVPAHAEGGVRDLEREEANRKLVVEFYDRVFNRHQVEEGASVLVESYRQHNPAVPDGKAPFVSFFTSKFKSNPEARARIVRSSANDDLVWLHVHSTERPDDRGRAIVDIFRVKDGRIVEHWDVIQPVPEKAANGNTMF
ncbi:nuclear transport factor 2 family protein [Bosea thiooxidans]